MGSIAKSVGGFVGKIVGGLTGASDAADAAKEAAGIQAGAAQSGIEEQRRQFDQIQALLQPFVGAGSSALTQQKDILGLNGADAQQAVIDAIQKSPYFTSQLRTGENSILANASATGGLRGGNTQSALAQFSPALLSQAIQQQYGNLSGLSTMGQNAAAMTGTAGANAATSISNLLQQQGSYNAGGALAEGGVARQGFNDLLSIGSLAVGAKKAGLF